MNPLESVTDRVEDRTKKVVDDGALVLDTVRQVLADLLILDIMMPGLSGLEVYDGLREDAGIRDMPVPFDLLERVRYLCPA